jgi:lipoprotein-anchoring transpeptidase ErfK/SrfK
MPDNERRPRPVHLKAAPRRKPRPKTPRKPRAPRPGGNDSTLVFWIIGGVFLLAAGLIALYLTLPQIQSWISTGTHQPPSANPEPVAIETPRPTLAPAVAPPLPTPAPANADEAQKRLQAKVKAETQTLAERPVVTPTPKPSSPPVHLSAVKPPVPPPVPSPPPNTEPPVAQPDNAVLANGAPARALPIDPNKLDTERIAAYQVALERSHFSCGFIDGDQGMRTQRMLRAFQKSRGLSTSGFLDQATRDAIGEPGEPFQNYIVTQADIDSIMPKPTSWRAKSQAKRLGYNDMWEMLAEKFHCTRAYLKALNHDLKTFVAGSEVIGPKVFPAEPIPKAASLRISLSETSIEALDPSGKIIAFFPCSIAKDKNKRPNGALTVKSVVPNPDYTFDPALFADAAKAEGITKKMVLPPGPRNPVGTDWIGLSLPGYGIHGTPEPEKISATQSHGCFRLANWNADKVLKMVKVGTPIDVQP